MALLNATSSLVTFRDLNVFIIDIGYLESGVIFIYNISRVNLMQGLRIYVYTKIIFKSSVNVKVKQLKNIYFAKNMIHLFFTCFILFWNEIDIY